MIDYRERLRHVKCWDRDCERLLEEHGEAKVKAVLQNREELIALCEFIESKQIRSFLEIGIWTGDLLSNLHAMFRFDIVAACDHRWAERHGLSISVPQETRFLDTNSDSEAYLAWRRELGLIDLVFIDANHHYKAVRRDFEINRELPHRFLAFHDISGARSSTQGVKQFWDELSEGHKLEILRPHRELGLEESMMGIGIWSSTEDPNEEGHR